MLSTPVESGGFTAKESILAACRILQLSIESPVSPITSIAPLTFVVAVTAIKQAYEDWLRHHADLQVNNRSVRILRNGELQRVQAKHIKVRNSTVVAAER